MDVLQTKQEPASNAIEVIEKISIVKNEPKWLIDKRLSAWNNYLKKPLPDRVTHLWRYSDPAWFELNDKEISTKKIRTSFNLDEEAVKKGIVLLDLNEAIKKYQQLVLKTFGELIKDYSEKTTYLNEALWLNGFFLYVPRGVRLDKPVVVNTANDESNDKFSALRILIVLEEEANVSFIHRLSSNEISNLLTNVVIEIFLAPGSKLNYLNIQTNGKQTTQHLFQRAILAKHAELTNLVVALGGKVSKANLGATLNGLNAGITTYGIVLGDESQKFDHHTVVEHKAPHTRSSLDFRVALKDKARSAYTGNLRITDKAIKSDAHQENRNLLLSDNARAESIPELEILTNDVVRCNHGVTVGQVDKEQIYYLMSRGLSEKEAERIIIEGFLEPTISRIPLDSLRDEILEKVKSKLEDL